MLFVFPNSAKMEMADFQLGKNSNGEPGKYIVNKIIFRKDMKSE